jgi:hypothetical protein
MKLYLFLAVSASIMLCSFVNKESSAVTKVANRSFTDSTDEVQKVWFKKNVIRLDPNPSYDGTVNVSSTISGPLHFYIFDLDGTMMYQATLNKKEKKSINNLQKGTYMYDVFQNDVSIEEGKIIVK